MAIGRISGPMLYSNLDRQGANLTVDTDLVQFDVINRRLGVRTANPTEVLDINGNVRLANILIKNNAISSETGKINFGSNTNVLLSGGTNYDVLYTDGNGNLAWASLGELSGESLELSGDTIILGNSTQGDLTSNALTLVSTTTVTDSIALINELLGNITNTTGSVITTDAVYGVLMTNTQPHINTVGNLTSLNIDGDLVVSGNTNFSGAANLKISDNIISIHTTQDLSDWTFDDNKDVGVKFLYFDTQAGSAFLGYKNDSQYLEYFATGSELPDGTFSGVDYGTFRTGEVILANTTPSVNATTGALRVFGGAGIQGNVNAANVTGTVADFQYLSGVLAAPFVDGTVTTANVSYHVVVSEIVNNQIHYLTLVDKLSGNVAEFTDSALSYDSATGTLGAPVFSGDADLGTVSVSDFSTANAVISGGYIQNLANISAQQSDFVTMTSVTMNATTGNVITQWADNFSSANVAISGGYVVDMAEVSAETGIFGNLSTDNAQVTGGDITGITDFSATTGVITNFSSGNAQVTGGDITGITEMSASTLVATNFSTANAEITGGNVTNLQTVSASTAEFVTLNTDNVQATSGNITGLQNLESLNGNIVNLVSSNVNITGGTISSLSYLSSATGYVGNFSSGNVLITGGDVIGLDTLSADLANITQANVTTLSATNADVTTLVVNNFSSANAQITGGSVIDLTDLSSQFTYTDNFSTGNAEISGGDITGITDFSAITGVITNFSSGNVEITGGDITDLTELSATTASITDLTSTTGNITTLESENFTSGNVNITGGTIDASAIQGTSFEANVSFYQNLNNTDSSQTHYLAFYPALSSNSAVHVDAQLSFNPNTNTITTDTIQANVVGNITGTVLTANQPLITDLGTLNSLAVAGNITADVITGSGLVGNVTASVISAQVEDIQIVPANTGKLYVVGNTAMQIPSGITDDRPVGAPGMIRYNYDSGSLEFYNGVDWISAIDPSFNADETFYGNGVDNTYPLGRETVSNAILVSINGTLQTPGSAYSVSGNQITFSEVPLTTDEIYVRYLSSITTPVINTTVITTGGKLVTTADTIIDVWEPTDYRSAKYNISCTSVSASEAQFSEVMLTHYAGNVFINTTNTVGGTAVTFSANIVNDTLYVYATGTASDHQLTIQKTYFIS